MTATHTDVRDDERDPRAVPRTYFTADLPGVGGTIKERPEDFLVDEIPLYPPTGTGEHIYLTIQKRLMSTAEMLDVVARHFGVARRALGYAGLKDKCALTRQAVTVHTPGRTLDDFPMLRHERLEVHGAAMHASKLRPGHLRGNRFSVRIRGVRPTDVRLAHQVLLRLAGRGMPNRVGEQRFGILQNNHLIGRALVLGDHAGAVQELLGPNAAYPEINPEARALFGEGRYREAIGAMPNQARTEMRVLHQLALGKPPRVALRHLDKATIGFYLAAFQSAVFNTVLDRRLAEGSLDLISEGDLAIKHENLAVFAVDGVVLVDPATVDRLRRFEISPSGPMWSAAMLRAKGRVDDQEVGALSSLGVSPQALDAFDRAGGSWLEGKRRPLRVPLIDPEVEGGVDEHGPYIRCAFELPRGSFATVALREVMKPDAAPAESWQESEAS